jgi:hypothetical protein
MKNEKSRDTGNIRGTTQHNYKQTSKKKRTKKGGTQHGKLKNDPQIYWWTTPINPNYQLQEAFLWLKLRSTSKGNDKN